MLGKKVSLFLAIIALVGVTYAYSGTLLNAQTMYALQDMPAPPSNFTIEVTGKWSHNGKIVLRVFSVDTNCVDYQGTPICGNKAIDSTVTIAAVHEHGPRSRLVLESHVDNPGPQNTGTSTDLKLTGFWDKNGDIEINFSYTLEPRNKGPTAYAIVSLKNIYTGKVNSQNVYNGHVFARANAYLVINNVPRLTPYQMVIIPMTPFTSAVENRATPYRALSPYATTSLSNPVAAYEISGELTNIVLGADDFFSATAHIYTPNDYLTLNKTGTIYGKAYAVPRYEDMLHIYASRFTSDDGIIYALDNADFVIQ